MRQRQTAGRLPLPADHRILRGMEIPADAPYLADRQVLAMCRATITSPAYAAWAAEARLRGLTVPSLLAGTAEYSG